MSFPSLPQFMESLRPFLRLHWESSIRYAFYRFMESFDLQEWTRIGAMNLIE